MQLDLIFDGRPVPNENGVYDDDDGVTVAMPQTKSRASARVIVIEVSPGEWVFATCYMLNTLGAASLLSAYPHDIRSPSSSEAVLQGLSQLAHRMDRAEKDNSSTAPSKAQIKQVRDWITSQIPIYKNPLLAAA